VADGGRIRAAGQGGGGSDGGARGDLLVRVRILPNPAFRRAGDDLNTRIGVPLRIALLGGTVDVPTLRGTSVQLTIPPETQNGARMRLRGLGMPRLKGSGSGDLYAEVDVRLPLPLSPEARAAAADL